MVRDGRQNRSKLTNQIIEKLFRCIELDCTIQEACDNVGLDRHTFYRWLDKSLRYEQLKLKQENLDKLTRREKEELRINIIYSGFAKRYYKSKNKLMHTARNVVAKAIEDGDTKLASEYIYKKDKRYRSDINVSNNGFIQINCILDDIIGLKKGQNRESIEGEDMKQYLEVE